jgi:hypothetical protein
MEKYVNNWRQPVELAQGATTLALALDDGEYRLSLRNADSTAWEIITAVVVLGTATLTRGQEGTADQAWPAGSFIYQSVTAGMLSGLNHQYAGSGDPNGVVVAPVNSHYLDTNSATIWFCIEFNGITSYWQQVAFEREAFASGTITVGEPLTADIIVSAGTVFFDFAGPIYSTETLTGSPRAFTIAGESLVSLQKVTGGGVVVTVTPVTLYS